MISLNVILLWVGFILCFISAFYNPPRVHLGWLGVALSILSLLIH